MFIIDLQTIDEYVRDPSDLQNGSLVNRFLNEIEEHLNITLYKFKGKALKIKSVQGPDKEKIFQTVNPIKYLKLGKETCKKTLEKYEAIEYCWINYWIIYSKIIKK